MFQAGADAGFLGLVEGRHKSFSSGEALVNLLSDWVEMRSDAELVRADEEMQEGMESREVIQHSGHKPLKTTISKLGTIFLAQRMEPKF